MGELLVNLPACLIGMEAWGSTHHWARKLHGFGHTVKLMAPQFVVSGGLKARKNGGQARISVVRRENQMSEIEERVDR